MTLTPDLRGQHAIVTGGGRGLGAAIASALAAQGARVTLMSRTAAAILAHAETIRRQTHADVHAVVCDVAEPASIRQAFDDAARHFGPAHILVNNAGQADAALVQDITLDSWDRLLRVNLTGTLLCTQQVLPAMMTTGAGRIINVASTAGLKGYAKVGAYVASKHGILGLTKTAALENARAGVRVNAICPGSTDTPMLQGFMAGSPEARKMILASTPPGRLGTPEEIAEAAVWLLSDRASYVSGESLFVDYGAVSR